jgi:epsilon-lactone hydrolase
VSGSGAAVRRPTEVRDETGETTLSDTPPDYVQDLYERWSATLAERGELPLDEWRATNEKWAQVTAEPGGPTTWRVDARGVPAMWLAPTGAAEDRVVLGLHGGGFATGSM